MHTAKKLTELRQARGWGVKEAATTSKLSWVTLEKYEAGVILPASCNLKRIQHYWQLTPDEVFALAESIIKDKELFYATKSEEKR